MRTKALLMILFLTACGGSDGPVEPPPPPPPPPPPTPIAVSMTAELYQTLENGDCDFDIMITAKGEGRATWTGLGVVWHRDGVGYPDSRDAAWLTDWLGQPGVSETEPATGALITLPDSLYMVLRYRTDAGRADSASVMLRCG